VGVGDQPNQRSINQRLPPYRFNLDNDSISSIEGTNWAHPLHELTYSTANQDDQNVPLTIDLIFTIRSNDV
jgi:hypothetical protein